MIEGRERERREGSYDNVCKSVHANVQTRSSFRSAITPTHSAHHTTKKLTLALCLISMDTTWRQHR